MLFDRINFQYKQWRNFSIVERGKALRKYALTFAFIQFSNPKSSCVIYMLNNDSFITQLPDKIYIEKFLYSKPTQVVSIPKKNLAISPAQAVWTFETNAIHAWTFFSKAHWKSSFTMFHFKLTKVTMPFFGNIQKMHWTFFQYAHIKSQIDTVIQDHINPLYDSLTFLL